MGSALKLENALVCVIAKFSSLRTIFTLQQLLLQHVFLKVRTNLPKKFITAKEMHKTAPLEISAEVKDKDASAYKATMAKLNAFMCFCIFSFIAAGS